MTYTVLASNPDTGELGIASTTITINFSRTFPVHRHLLPDLTDRGIIVAPMATIHPQNGHRLCDLRDAGVGWDDMEAELEKQDEHWSWRQIGAVTATGETWVRTGSDAWSHASHIVGEGSIAMGNFMGGPEPVKAMAKVLEDNRGEAMDERLLRAIEAGKAASGQEQPDLDPSRTFDVYGAVFDMYNAQV